MSNHISFFIGILKDMEINCRIISAYIASKGVRLLADYDFKQLSSYDFELLTRDLLQEEFGITLESFKTGRDKGIDLRYAKDAKNTLIIQCKHYAGSTYNNLKTAISGEVPKLSKIKCNRYILATSFPLSPVNKDEIKKILTPYCQSVSDIYGKEDINNLITKYPVVEKNHYKLWLTSTTVMERILHSGVYNQSQIEISHIINKSKFYVQNKSFFVAMKILKELNYCIISGIPGIGKTTLAEILILYFLSKGFEVIKVQNSIKEALEVYNPEKFQLFYYDDFLGQTTLKEKFSKNEDSQLLRFIDVINKSKKAKFILTTREYILNQAKLNYERIATSDFDIEKCTISLNDYTKFDRAKILFNHLYFSEIPIEKKEQLLYKKNYKKIINHHNYNPRIIEWMTVRYLNKGEEDYFEEFKNILDNPKKLWEHIFDNQLNLFSRNLLLILVTMHDKALLGDLEEAFLVYHREKAKAYGYLTTENDFRNALKELDGNFIYSRKIGNDTIIQLSNPSVRDFLENYVLENITELKGLLKFSVFFGQVYRLYSLMYNKHDGRKKMDDKYFAEYLSAFEMNFKSKSFSIQNSNNKKEVLINTLSSRLEFILCELELRGIENKTLVEKLFSIVLKDMQFSDLEGFFSLLRKISDTNYKYLTEDTSMIARVKEVILSKKDYSNIDDFYAVVLFHEFFPGNLNNQDLDEIKENFSYFCQNDIESRIDDASYSDELVQYKESLADLGEFFGLDLSEEVSLLEDNIYEFLEREKEEPPDDYYDDDYRGGGTSYDTSEDMLIDNMFDTLFD